MLEEVLYVVLALVVTGLLATLLKFRHAHGYWRRKGVPFVHPHPLYGNAKDLFFLRSSLYDFWRNIYNQLEGYRFGGFYIMDKPCLLLCDPDIIYQIRYRDYDYFHERGLDIQETGDTITDNHFRIRGERLLEIQKRFLHAFGPAKTGRMFFLLETCAERMVASMEARLNNHSSGQAYLKEVSMRFAIDALGCCAFGIECGAIDDRRSQFLYYGQQLTRLTCWQAFGGFVKVWLPTVSKILGTRFFSKDIYDFFRRVALETVEYRQQNNLRRDDVLHSLLEVGQRGFAAAETISTELSDDELVSQVSVLFVMGFALPSMVMCMALLEMVHHPEVQNVARLEVDAALRKHGGKLTYEAIRDMAYLDMVVHETLRLHPPTTQFMVECVSEYTIPGSSVKLEPGTKVIAPMLALQRNPRYFPEPMQFDPLRFRPENRSSIHPGTFMPFGVGPRACLGE